MRRSFASVLVATLVSASLTATASEVNDGDSTLPTLDELKQSGAQLSSYRSLESRSVGTEEVPKARLELFRSEVGPVLISACIDCHGPDTQEGNVRIDTLDPNLFSGSDVDWWLEVLAVLSNGEMPPDGSDLSDEDRTRVVQWLSSEMQAASKVRRDERAHSSFRRMTQYEYNYALQDLLGLPYDFAKELPPESVSEDGFLNSSDMLHMSAMQFETYREASLAALRKATVRGEQPEPLYWSISMQGASSEAWENHKRQLKEIREQHQDDPDKLQKALDEKMEQLKGSPRHTHYKLLSTGQTERVHWAYQGARYAWNPTTERPEIPDLTDGVSIIPPRQKMVVELGNKLPEHGMLRVRVRASRASMEHDRTPAMRIEFGFQASNDSNASVRISEQDVFIDAAPGSPQFYEWNFPLSELSPRNLIRKTAKMGELPSPSEFLKIVNGSNSGESIQVDYVEVAVPIYEPWPPVSHKRILKERDPEQEESTYARQILDSFMSRAWRREVTEAEVEQKLALLEAIRPACDDFQEAMLEVLATVLSSPQFLYLAQANDEEPQSTLLKPDELATRLSMFLWCSTPDEELNSLAASGQLSDAKVLAAQVERMLADQRSERFSENFVRQWLGLQLLDYLDVDRKAYPRFDRSLKASMQQEPIAFFQEVLRNDNSVVDFLHADYTMANERLAKHYGLKKVYGDHFRRVELAPEHARGGLLTQAGLLAMNSDGKDSHPLKRSVWLLERLLNDPPPPPPPAVPEIDLTDPEIAKLTLKQRILDHRNQAACMSCHAKIDPWGIAFENYDAVGTWRTQIEGKPVDASSELFNGHEIHGMDGLKRFLLQHRQDQFVRAMVHKMATYALGRPLTFGDRASVEQITADVRNEGDGLATMVEQIATSELFQSK